MAVDADRGIAHSVLDGFAVNTLVELAGDFLVALRTCPWHFPVIDSGARIGSGINIVTAVATGTGGRFLAERNGAGVNALLVRIDRMRHGNFVARQKSSIAMALGAGVGHILAGNGRVRLAGAFTAWMAP